MDNVRMKTISRFAFGSVLGLAIAASSALPTGGRTLMAQPQTCGLLSSDEVQALAPNQNVTGAAVSPSQGAGGVACRYMWGEGVQHFTLTLSVQPAARMFAGMSADAIKQYM